MAPASRCSPARRPTERVDGLTDLGEHCRLVMHVRPGARKTAMVGIIDGSLRIHLAARPVDGAANAALITFLARRLLRLPRSRVRLVRGVRARYKQVEIAAPAAVVAAAITAALSDGPSTTERSPLPGC